MVWVYSKRKQAEERLLSDAEVITIIILLVRWKRTATLKCLVVFPEACFMINVCVKDNPVTDCEKKGKCVLFMFAEVLTWRAISQH